MNIQRTDKDFEKYEDIKKDITSKVHCCPNKDPIKEWQNWIDLEIEDLQILTGYLLFELVSNEPLTSITKIIPLIEDRGLKVGVTMYIDEESIYASNKVKDDFTPLFISTNDLVNILKKLIDEYKDSPMDFAIKELIHRLAYELKIVRELK